MKNQATRSMQKSNNRSSKKNAGEGEEKSSGRKQTNRRNVKKSGSGAHDDDDSVDSKGNIRDLIVTSEDEEDEAGTSSDEWDDEDDSDLTPEIRTEIRRTARKAGIAARDRIKKQLLEEEEASTRKNKKKAVPTRSPLKKQKEKSRGFVPKKKKVVESEEEEEDDSGEVEEDEDDDDDDDEDEDEDEDDDEDDDEDEDDEGGFAGISINISELGDFNSSRMKPKRHNMKKETDIIKKFVKLVTKPVEDNTIDDQIDQFKTLSVDKQAQLIGALERKSQPNAQDNLMFKILTMSLPPDTQTMVLSKYNSLQGLDPSSGEYFKTRAWLEKLTSLPLGIYKDIPVNMGDGTEACGNFMSRAHRCLEESIYGQEEAKLQILQFIASKIANPAARGLSLLLAGPPGIGKTSIIKNGIAKALSWPFQFISLGGDSDASTYTGHQLVYEGSHSGKIVNSLAAAKSMSMVLMFDEIDKISTTPKGEEVGNLLIHLTDPVQNADFEDKYLSGIPLDLSKVMFVFSGNDLNKVDRVLLDRMIVINLQGYNAKEKLAIAENFLLPQALKEVNLDEKVHISKEVLQYVIEEFAKEEAGVRELKRCIEQIIQKINMLRIFNNKDLPFHIPDFHLPFVVKKEHATLFLKKKTGSIDMSYQRMYT